MFLLFSSPILLMIFSPMVAGLRQLWSLFLWMGGPGCRGEYYLVIFVFIRFFSFPFYIFP